MHKIPVALPIFVLMIPMWGFAQTSPTSDDRDRDSAPQFGFLLEACGSVSIANSSAWCLFHPQYVSSRHGNAVGRLVIQCCSAPW